MIKDKVIKHEWIDWKSLEYRKNVVYCVLNLINGKVYIGKTTKTLLYRKEKHLKTTKKNRYYFHNAIKKHGQNNFKWYVLQICNNEDELNEHEINYIASFKSYNSKYGYNLTLGGEGCSANKETKEKISKSNKGKAGFWTSENYPESAKKKLSIKLMGNKNNFGKKQSEETKKKISETLTGRKRPIEVGEKISQSLKGKKQSKENIEKRKKVQREKSKKVLHINTGIIYNSTPEASEQLNITVNNIWRVCSGVRKQYKGNYFNFYE